MNFALPPDIGTERIAWTDDPTALPTMPGAYLLHCIADRPLLLPPRFGGTLPPGDYIYVGSARQPGGIRARCRRHLTRGKARRWHIDWITEEAAAVRAAAMVAAAECTILGTLLTMPGMSVPVPGFGSSDCRSCPAPFPVGQGRFLIRSRNAVQSRIAAPSITHR